MKNKSKPVIPAKAIAAAKTPAPDLPSLASPSEFEAMKLRAEAAEAELLRMQQENMALNVELAVNMSARNDLENALQGTRTVAVQRGFEIQRLENEVRRLTDPKHAA